MSGITIEVLLCYGEAAKFPDADKENAKDGDASQYI